MRHTEVAEAPSKRRCHRQCAVASDSAFRDVKSLKYIEVSVHILYIAEDIAHAVRHSFADAENDQKCDRHDDGLDEVRGRCREESAERAVEHDDDRAGDHGVGVGNIEQRGKEFTAGGESRRGVWHEENYDEDCGNKCDDVMLIAEALTKEIRERDRIDFLRIDTESFRDEEPVQVCTHRQAERRPECLRNTRHQGNRRKSHQEPGAHVGSLRTHRGNDRTELSAA